MQQQLIAQLMDQQQLTAHYILLRAYISHSVIFHKYLSQRYISQISLTALYFLNTFMHHPTLSCYSSIYFSQRYISCNSFMHSISFSVIFSWAYTTLPALYFHQALYFSSTPYFTRNISCSSYSCNPCIDLILSSNLSASYATFVRFASCILFGLYLFVLYVLIFVGLLLINMS